MGSSLSTQITALAMRSVLRTLRQPAVIVSALLFPMMFFAINAYGLDAAARIPGFPADSYLDFAFAFPLIQASLFGAVTAGGGPPPPPPSGLFFVAIFMSSINLPRDLIEADWFRFIATINPISYLVEGIRSLVITGWDVQALLVGFGCAAAIVVLALGGAVASLKARG